MNRAVAIGIIVAIVGIGIFVALGSGFDLGNVESSDIEIIPSESGGNDFKVTLKEDLGIEGTP